MLLSISGGCGAGLPCPITALHAQLILITDKLSSCLAIHADAVLPCDPESDGFCNSITPAAYLCDVLLNKCAEATDEVEKRYAYVDQFIDPLRFF